MVALLSWLVPMTRAPTQVTCSLLKIVKSTDRISLISPAQISAALPFGFRRNGRLYFKNLHPSAGAGRPLYTLTQITVNIFPSTIPFPGSCDVERRRIIGLGILVSTAELKIIEISFSKPRAWPLKDLSPADHNHPEIPDL